MPMQEMEDSLLLEIGPMSSECLRELGFLDDDKEVDNGWLTETYSDLYTNGEIYFDLSSENLSTAQSTDKTRYIKELKKHILFFLEVAETQAAFYVLKKMDLPIGSSSKQDRHRMFVEMLRGEKDKFDFSAQRAQSIERLHLLGLLNKADYGATQK
jgi:hypothetical protein